MPFADFQAFQQEHHVSSRISEFRKNLVLLLRCLSLIFKLFNKSTMFPAEFLRKTFHSGEFSVRLETQSTSCSGDTFPWLVLEIPRDTLITAKSHEGCRTPLRFVWEHSSNSPGEDCGRGSGVEWTSAWVGCHALSEEVSESQFISEKWP